MLASAWIRKKTSRSVLALTLIFAQVFAALLIPVHGVVHAHVELPVEHGTAARHQFSDSHSSSGITDSPNAWDAVFGHAVGDACDDWNTLALETALAYSKPTLPAHCVTYFFAVPASHLLPSARYPITALPRAPPAP